MQRRIWRKWFWPAGWLVVGALLAAVSSARAATRVALLNFVCDDNSYRSTVAAMDFTATLQAQLAAEKNLEWVERADLSRAENEFKLSYLGLIDRFESLRNGRWVKADWAVLGRIATNTPSGRSVALEVVDLHRAETLAQFTLTNSPAAAGPLRVVTADVARVADALRLLLQQAERQQAGHREKTSVAILFFSASEAGRDYSNLEAEFLRAVVTNQPTVRFTQFARAGEAMEEANLVLSGLAQTDVDAWEKVADVYIWGNYRVENRKKLNRQTQQLQDERRVTATLNLWAGHAEPQQIMLSFTNAESVGGFARRLAEVVSPLLHRSAEKTSADGVRQKVSASLLAHALELARSARNPTLTSPEGRQQWMDVVQVLETSCFFDPGNQMARELWLRVRWGSSAMAASPNEFFFARRRSEAWRKHVEDFGFESKCPAPPNRWWEKESVASGFILSALRPYEMFKYSQRDLARWGIPYDAGGPELAAWRRRFGEDLYARVLVAPDDERVFAQAWSLFYGVLAMNGNEFVLRDVQQRQRLLEKLWPQVQKAQTAHPAEFDGAYRRGLRLHFEQLGQRDGERVWLTQLEQIAQTERDRVRAQPVQLPRASILDTKEPAPQVTP